MSKIEKPQLSRIVNIVRIGIVRIILNRNYDYYMSWDTIIPLPYFQYSMEKEAEKKTLYEAYTDYIDPATITVSHYLKEPFYAGQETYFEYIQQWLENEIEPNRPLVFKTTPGVGVKTILSHWYHNTVEANSNKKEKILPIIHFASSGSNNSNYFYCLYRIVIKLREILKIKQGVDLLEEKIRKYFAYWLDICNTEVERQKIVCSSEDIYSQIVIVIEGVDKFTDHETGKQANIAFWLPEFFPKNVKVICTVNDQSESLEYFEKKQCRIIPINISPMLSQKLLKQTLEKKTIFEQQMEKNLKSLLEKIYQNVKGKGDVYKVIVTYSSFFLVEEGRCKNKEALNLIKKTIQSKVKSGGLEKICKVSQIYDTILQIYGQAAIFKGRLTETLMYLALTQKGITVKQFVQLTKFNEEQWNIFQSIFRPLLVRYGKIFSIKSSMFTHHIMNKDGATKDSKLTKYHQKISQALENTFNSIRKLEEQTYHLFISKSYFKLKEIVSSIENFLLMFNPNNKYELSRYWQKLEEKGFDPVIQYNKAIQSFSMHYHPSDQNIFRIIVQVSKFLKEFCDFQTYETPAFRHPFIEGNMVQLQKIGLLGQLTDLGIYVDNSFNNLDQPDFICSCSLEEQIKQVRDKYFPKQKEQQPLSPLSILANTVEEIQKITSTKKMIKKSSTQILSQIEQLNVDVPMNRDKFRSFYLNSLQQYMKSEDFDPSQNDPGFFVVEDELDQANIQINARPEFSFNKIRENYRMRIIQPSLYYYKRWIWIQFPWACISLHNNYSNTPEFCNNIEMDSESYEQEAKHTKQALIVAIEAKEKKKMMFSKKSDDCNQKYGSRMKPIMMNTNKFSTFRTSGDKSSMRSRVLQKTFSNVDLHLNALTKELQMRKKDMPVQETRQKENDGFFLSQIKENCQEDIKFISQRKQFQIPGIEGVPANQILPKLKWTIKDHTNYQISYIKGHIEEKKKKLNKIIYENKKLAQTYKQLKLKQNLTKKSMNDQDSDKNPKKNKQLQQLIKKKEQVINQFCKSLLQKERLKIILKLCAENKTRNQEYLASLNYFLQNLKKMISWERNHIKQLTTQMNGKRAVQERKEAMQHQKAKNQKIVERQAKNYLQEKQKLEQQIENISIIIADDLRDQKDKLQNSLQGHMKNCEQKNKMLMQEKRTKQLEQQLKTLQEQYEVLKELFQIEGLQFEKSERFKHLLEENEKNKKLKIIYFERKTKLQQIQAEHLKLMTELEKKSNNKNQNQLSNDKKIKDINQQKNSQSKQKLKNKLKIILSNMCMKIGAQNPSQMVPMVKKKLDQMKQKDPARYSAIMSKQQVLV